jgi:hypothetical protein
MRLMRNQLSQNFFLDEFTRSETAARHGIAIVVEPDSGVYRNLVRLCGLLLQPLRDGLGAAVHVTSGYRPPAVNRLVGGSSTSSHVFGLAADVVVAGHTPHAVAEWLARSDLLFDQVIHEFGQWVHLSVADEGEEPAREVLTAYRAAGRTAYARGVLRMEEVA